MELTEVWYLMFEMVIPKGRDHARIHPRDDIGKPVSRKATFRAPRRAISELATHSRNKTA